MVKKTALSEYDSPRVGLIAINLRGDDELIGVKLTSGEDDLLFVSRKGMAVRFSESHVRPMGRQTSGVTAMRLRRGDQVLAMEVVRSNADLLVVTDAGYGKRTPLEQYAQGPGHPGRQDRRADRGPRLHRRRPGRAGRGRHLPHHRYRADHPDARQRGPPGWQGHPRCAHHAAREDQRPGRRRGAGRQGRGVANVQPVPAGADAAVARPAATAMAPAVDRRARLVLRRLDPGRC